MPKAPLPAALALVLLAAPAAAWEAHTNGAVCELTHDTAEARAYLSYDPAGPLYTITLTLKGATWPPAPAFSIRFDGPQGMTISTSRQTYSDAGRALTVTDTGFGNVLNGLELNDTATALLGGEALTLPLDGAAPAVEAFRACARGLNA